MPQVDIDRVLSVNSEDCAFPAVNLINADSKKQWRCKPGEKQATVILQLKQETSIDSIDIGNEHSAFVEILVGKSTSSNNDFKVLLVASSLMSLKESKDGTNTKGVRFFKKDQLTQSTADEKWDRVKIVCTQPFNKHVQYGLSFIVLHSSSGVVENEPEGGKVLGRFNLKQEDNDDAVSVGSWFAKRKDPLPTIPAKAAAAIRDASSPINNNQTKNKKPTTKMLKVTTPKIGATEVKKNTTNPSVQNAMTPKFNLKIRDDEDSPADDTDADSNYSPTKDTQSRLSDDDDIPESDDGSDSIISKRPKRNKKGQNTKNSNSLKRKNSDPGSSSKAKIAKPLNREMRPFRRLLEGVTFVISGYQNPLRADLRTKAIEMGARYKPDWDHNCTHLICAFINTPKFSQVQGRGKIVKKEWIQECHSTRKRLPWRRFALDRNHAGTSSEEEIWEEVSLPSSSNVNNVIASGINRRNISSGSDTEEEIERVRAKKTTNKANTPSEITNITVKVEDRFSDETDVDSDGGSQTAKLPLPPLPDFFNNIKIHIALDVDQQERKMLTRYIIAYKGHIVGETDNSMEYVISNSTGVAATFGEHFGVTVVSPDWVWKSSDEGKLLPPLKFKLKYNTDTIIFLGRRTGFD